MPELPEVETNRRGIAPHVTGGARDGAARVRIDVYDSRLRWPVPADLGTRLRGKTIERVRHARIGVARSFHCPRCQRGRLRREAARGCLSRQEPTGGGAWHWPVPVPGRWIERGMSCAFRDLIGGATIEEPFPDPRTRGGMNPSRDLAARFEAYADWRRRLSAGISSLHEWLQQQDLADAQVEVKVQQILERLQQDKLVVAFVAEFSRGKSELINAIFFADFGQRLLPSSAGRTTMCPTELLHDPSRPPSIRLLPIETRLNDATVTEFKSYADEWVTFPLDLGAAERMARGARARVAGQARADRARAEVRAVQRARRGHPVGARAAATRAASTFPCWRHAIINFPHPLLQQGLVILDTPGLNAIGTEPELTLNLLPNAHAILFLLAADAGVTKTDLDVWNDHLAGDDPATKSARLVILNKIDGLWDDLKEEVEINAEIDRQVDASAAMLGISPAQVFARLGAEGAARQGQRRRRAARAKPPAGARAFAVAQADPGEARPRRRRDAGRAARA